MGFWGTIDAWFLLASDFIFQRGGACLHAGSWFGYGRNRIGHH